jgi:hypothetical protein
MLYIRVVTILCNERRGVDYSHDKALSLKARSSFRDYDHITRLNHSYPSTEATSLSAQGMSTDMWKLGLGQSII